MGDWPRDLGLCPVLGDSWPGSEAASANSCSPSDDAGLLSPAGLSVVVVVMDSNPLERLRQGFVRVAWHPKGEELVEKEKKVRAKNMFSVKDENRGTKMEHNRFSSFTYVFLLFILDIR